MLVEFVLPEGMIRTLSSEKGDGSTVGTSTTGTTDAVNVIFRVVRVVIVEHMGDIANILKERLASNQGGDQNDDQGMIA